MLGTTGVRVIHICTDLESHLTLAREALSAGCNVLIEKPLAPDSAGLEEILALADSNGLLVCPVHQFLFQRGILALGKSGEAVGTIRHFEMEVASTGAESGTLGRDAAALEILPHGLALAARLCGTGIALADWSLQRATEGEISVGTVFGQTRIGIRISMQGRPPVNRLRLVTDSGTVEADLFNGFSVWDRTASSRVMKLFRPIRSAAVLGGVAVANLVARTLRSETAYPGLRELVRRFYSASLGDESTPIGNEESRAVTAAWTSIRQLLDAPTRKSNIQYPS